MRLSTFGGSGSVSERVAWFALLAVPAVVPAAVSKVPFSDAAALTLNLYVVPKVFACAILMAVALCAWAVGVMGGTIRNRSVPHSWWLVAFLGLSVVSTALGVHPSTSFFGGRYHLAGLLIFLLASALFFLLVQLVHSADRIRAMSWSAVAGGVLVAGIGVLQAAGMDPMRTFDPAYPYLTLRGGSLLGNPDFSGSYLVVPAVVAASLALSAKSVAARVAAFGCFATILLAMLNTGTRGAWVGAAVGLVALGVAFVRSSGKITKAGYAGLGVALGVPLLWLLTNMSRFLERFADLSQGSELGGGRLAIWHDALSMIAARPLFGTGPDAYRLGWYGARSAEWVKAVGVNVINEDPHNAPLLFAATLGIPATVAIIGFVVIALAGSARSALMRDASPGRLILSGWWAALIAFSVTLFFTTNSTVVMVMLFTAVGMVVAVQARPVDFSKPLVYGLGVAALALAVTAGTVGTLYLRSDVLLMQAETSADKIALTDEAARLAPWYGDAQYRATMARGNAALAALESGLPSGAQDARAAEARFDRLVAFNPLEYQFRAAQAFFLINAGSALGPDTLNRAIAAGQAALDISPLSSQAAYLKGLAQLNQGKPSAAVETLKPLWDIDPKFVDPGVVYFRALVATGNRAEAEIVLAKLQLQFPGDREVAALQGLLNSPNKAQ